jgi:hypothetical protein
MLYWVRSNIIPEGFLPDFFNSSANRYTTEETAHATVKNAEAPNPQAAFQSADEFQNRFS